MFHLRDYFVEIVIYLLDVRLALSVCCDAGFFCFFPQFLTISTKLLNIFELNCLDKIFHFARKESFENIHLNRRIQNYSNSNSELQG